VVSVADVVAVLEAIDRSPFYITVLYFFGIYPIGMAGVWVVMSLSQFQRRERTTQGTPTSSRDYEPFVSVVVPAYAEEDAIARTLDALLTLDYPAYEVIVVNDGSPDATADRVRPYLGSGIVRLLDKRQNEGKALALNDALPLCRGEIVLIMDSDIVATPGLLRAMVPHFQWPRVGAVTGNPRVANRGSLLRNLQSLEFASIVSVQRRAQRVWGRVLTVSGAVAAFRKTALIDAGMFSSDMATEDIDMTWKLQRQFWDVRYEAGAVVWMEVPPTLGELWKQRRRWSRGLAQVLVKHRHVPLRWNLRRLWPVFYEGVASILWAYTFMFIVLFWSTSHLLGYAPLGSSPIPNVWGMTIATACLLQLFTGVMMDRRYDPTLPRVFPVAIVYPIIYWMLMSLITSIYTLDGALRKRPQLQTWKIRRVET
jgi:poly-beta-1,6-N-acetyl-D-glucosamine synthase